MFLNIHFTPDKNFFYFLGKKINFRAWDFQIHTLIEIVKYKSYVENLSHFIIHSFQYTCDTQHKICILLKILNKKFTHNLFKHISEF